MTQIITNMIFSNDYKKLHYLIDKMIVFLHGFYQMKSFDIEPYLSYKEYYGRIFPSFSSCTQPKRHCFLWLSKQGICNE